MTTREVAVSNRERREMMEGSMAARTSGTGDLRPNQPSCSRETHSYAADRTDPAVRCRVRSFDQIKMAL